MTRRWVVWVTALLLVFPMIQAYVVQIKDTYAMRQTCSGVRAGTDSRVDGMLSRAHLSRILSQLYRDCDHTCV